MLGIAPVPDPDLTGCATYHPMPLDKAAVDKALAPPALESIPY